jgi:hypothetical protein
MTESPTADTRPTTSPAAGFRSGGTEHEPAGGGEPTPVVVVDL